MQAMCPIANQSADAPRVDQVHEMPAADRVQGRVGQALGEITPRRGRDHRIPAARQDECGGLDSS